MQVHTVTWLKVLCMDPSCTLYNHHPRVKAERRAITQGIIFRSLNATIKTDLLKRAQKGQN